MAYTGMTKMSSPRVFKGYVTQNSFRVHWSLQILPERSSTQTAYVALGFSCYGLYTKPVGRVGQTHKFKK